MKNEIRRSIIAMTDTVCTFDVTGNDNQDVELCLIHGLFNTDSPAVIERYTNKRYDQILSARDEHPLVKVKGNLTSLDETIWLFRNMDEVHSISITSPTARLKELDLEFRLSSWQSARNSMGGTDILSLNQIGEFSSPSEANIDLWAEPFDASNPHLFMSLNVKAGSFFHLSFAGRLKESFTPQLVLNHVPQLCKSCGAPLHGCKCNYCGTEY